MVTKQSVAVLSPELRVTTDPFGIDKATPSFTDPVSTPTGRRVWVDDCAMYVDIRFRMLTNRELSRAMSFDDEDYEYVFTGSQEEVTRMIGNAVPVRTARALCGAMLWDVLEAHARAPKETAPQPLAA
jgi:site-specific DNA-cytosine methylase